MATTTRREQRPSTPDDAPGISRTAYRTCPLCEAMCGLALRIRGATVEQTRGNPLDEFSRGYICPKGVALGELHKDRDRLRQPRLRENGRWRDASWDEAFQSAQRGLQGVLAAGERNAVGVYLGNPNVHNLAGLLYLRPLLRALNSRNLFTASTADQMPKEVANGLLYGDPEALAVPDVDRSHFLLLLGANPWESNGSLWTAPNLPERLRALRRRGGQFIVVDPRRTRSAERASQHLAIRPGADAPWLLSLINVLFAENLCEPDRLRPHLRGLDTVRDWVQPFTPERTEEHCGISAPTTRRIAQELAAAPAAAVYGRIGTTATAFGTLTSWAIDVLNILTGNLDRPGGVMFPHPAHARLHSDQPGGRGFSTGRWHSRVGGFPEVRGEFPSAALAEEIETPGPGQIRALICVAGNPVLSTPDGSRLDRALASLEFMVSVDLYQNETSRHAHVILPPPSPLERSHYDLSFTGAAVRTVARYSPPVFPRRGPSEAEILARLALAVAGEGAGSDPTRVDREVLDRLIDAEVRNPHSPVAGRDPAALRAELKEEDPCDRVVDFLLRTGRYGEAFGANPGGLSLALLRERPHSMDFGPMEPRLPGLLRTPSGRIELAPEPIGAEVERLRAELHASLAGDATPAQLLLIGRRELHTNNSWMHNLPALRRKRERCTLWMHPADAEARGLANGNPVRIESRVAAVVAPLETTEAIRPGVVSLPHGYGHHRPGIALRIASHRPGASANDLVPGDTDPLSGTAVLNGVPVEVAPTTPTADVEGSRATP